MNKDILIVDDEKDIIYLLAGIPQDEGYTRIAWDYNSLKKEYLEELALLLLDVWLENSDMDGIEILKLIKSYPDIPIIMISGHWDYSDGNKFIKS